MKVICFVGYAGSGKDTAAGAILRTFNGAQLFKWADTLKDVVCAVYGWDRERIDFDNDYKEEVPLLAPKKLFGKPKYQCPGPNGRGLSRRKVLQIVGTEGFRDMISDDTWLQAAMRYVRECEEFAAGHAERANIQGRILGWVNADTRFPNEAVFAKEEFDRAHIVRIHRVGQETHTTSSAHSSEKMIDEIVPDETWWIQEGDLNTLRQNAIDCAMQIFEEPRC